MLARLAVRRWKACYDRRDRPDDRQRYEQQSPEGQQDTREVRVLLDAPRAADAAQVAQRGDKEHERLHAKQRCEPHVARRVYVPQDCVRRERAEREHDDEEDATHHVDDEVPLVLPVASAPRGGHRKARAAPAQAVRALAVVRARPRDEEPAHGEDGVVQTPEEHADAERRVTKDHRRLVVHQVVTKEERRLQPKHREQHHVDAREQVRPAEARRERAHGRECAVLVGPVERDVPVEHLHHAHREDLHQEGLRVAQVLLDLAVVLVPGHPPRLLLLRARRLLLQRSHVLLQIQNPRTRAQPHHNHPTLQRLLPNHSRKCA